jgi:alkylation response protein AidB-like acyl-CoA dehydrogenase
MDFSLPEPVLAAGEAARGVFSTVTPERLEQVESSESRVDDELWARLADAGLLGLMVPEEYGGEGLGLLAACAVLEQAGRVLAAVPLAATLVVAPFVLARFAADVARRQWLPRIAAGTARVAAALGDVAGGRRLGVRAEPAGGESWRLEGSAFAVDFAHVADVLIVPASLRGQASSLVALVDPRAPGVRLQVVETSRRLLACHVLLDGCVVEEEAVVGEPDDRTVLEAALEVAEVARAALLIGIAGEALERTVRYVERRVQFGRPLVANQAVRMRLADGAIDLDAARVVLKDAAWRVDAGRPSFPATAVAAWWAGEVADRIVHDAQHLHGGIGADVSYPIHRYFLWGRQLSTSTRASGQILERIGEWVATGPCLDPVGPLEATGSR